MTDAPGGRLWDRPVPRIGDATTASQRAADPGGWAMPDASAGLYDVIAARRDVRRFRPDPVPPDVLQRVLAAAHSAPSVGHSQPWRFIVVRDRGIRDQAAVLTDRERLRQAAGLEPEAARRLLDLQLEGVREAPLGVVVCCDRRAAAAGVLGRATFPDADLWSCATAIQNLWLAARAEGLGLGWVTLFRPADLCDLLGVPDGVQTLGWLCLGWPDERPPAPGLERAGWSRRMPLADVVLDDRWPADDTAPAPPSSRLRAPGPEAVVGTRDQADRLLTTPGSLGILDRAADRVVATGGAGVSTGVLLIAASDHPVTAHGVSAYQPGVSREVTLAAIAGVSVGATAARSAGLQLVVADAGVHGDPLAGARDLRAAGPRGDLVNTAALTRSDARALVDGGRALGREFAGAGIVALGEIGVGNTTVAAALACGLLDADPATMTGLGAGSDSAMRARKQRAVRAAVDRARTSDPAFGRDPLLVLGELGGPELAVLTGAVLGVAESGGVVVLDGFAVSVAAAVAVGLEPAAQHHLIAGQRSRETGHPLVLQYLGCEPLLDLRMRAGEGAGAALATGMLLAALRIRRETARVTS